MGNYRQSRNIEASIMDYISSQLISAEWDDITIVKSFSEINRDELPVICVRIGTNNTIHNPVEIGDTSTYRIVPVNIDIFAENDGQKLDIKDFIVSVIKKGIPYYTISLINNVETKTLRGRLNVKNIVDYPLFSGEDKSQLDVKDRYRHFINFEVRTNIVED